MTMKVHWSCVRLRVLAFSEADSPSDITLAMEAYRLSSSSNLEATAAAAIKVHVCMCMWML